MDTVFNLIFTLSIPFRIAIGFACFFLANLIVAVLVLPLLLLPFRDLKKRAISAVIRWTLYFQFIKIMSWLGAYTLDVKISEKIDYKRPFIIVSNHISLLDPLILMSYIKNTGAVIKRRYTVILVVWLLVRVFDFIVVDENTKNDPSEYVEKFSNVLKKRNVLIYPEGARSKAGRVADFKKSAFVIAKELNVDVVPVAVYSPKPMFTKDSVNMTGQARYCVRVMDPINPREYKNASLLGRAACGVICKTVDNLRHSFNNSYKA